MLEQQRIKAAERVNNAGRLKAFLIEIPSEIAIQIVGRALSS